MIAYELIRRLPKVELHEHLDGSVRPETIISLAEERGIDLPETDPERLAAWFRAGSERRSLSLYLESFSVTTSIMQDEEALRRIAREEIEDLRLSLKAGMSRDSREQLLKLIDLGIELRDEISLASFKAGFQLALGIVTELKPFSFDEDEEQRALAKTVYHHL